MMTIFFLFLPRKTPAPGHDWMFTLVKRYVRWAVLRTVPDSLDFTPAAPGSHRDRLLSAARACLRCQHAIDGAEKERRRLRAQDHHGQNADPLGAGHRHGQGDNAQQLHDYWQKVAARWAELQAAGKIKSFSTPAALSLSPQRLTINRQKLQASRFPSGAATRLNPHSRQKVSVERLSTPPSHFSIN